MKKVYFKIHYSGKYNELGGELSSKLNVTCHKCGKMSYVRRYFQYNGNGSDGGCINSQRTRE